MSDLPRRLVDEIDDEEEAGEGRRLLRAAQEDAAPSARFTAAMAALGTSHGMTGGKSAGPSAPAIWRLRWVVSAFFAGGAILVGASFVAPLIKLRDQADSAQAAPSGTEGTSTSPASAADGLASTSAPAVVTVDMLPNAPSLTTSDAIERDERASAWAAVPSPRPRRSAPRAADRGARSSEGDVPPMAKPPSSATGSAGLEAELAMLKRARALVAVGDPAGALSALAGYETTFAQGVLTPEAEMIRIECLESLGRKDEARARAEFFLNRYQNTPQTVRVAALLRRLQ
jgi:hypothetical protein